VTASTQNQVVAAERGPWTLDSTAKAKTALHPASAVAERASLGVLASGRARAEIVLAHR
jgi:hypothetical protein